jgi:D-lactate dehydrogenase
MLFREIFIFVFFVADFNRVDEVSRYEALLEDVANLKYAGSLKAEHGTGRNMAPFVEREWGAEAFAIMREIKQLFDPQHLLNPGVIISDDPRIPCYQPETPRRRSELPVT